MDIVSRLQHAVSYELWRLEAGVNANEHPLSRAQYFLDGTQSALGITFAGELHIEVSDLIKQTWQQFSVVDIGAVGKILVSAWTCMDTDALALLRIETLQNAIVEVDE